MIQEFKDFFNKSNEDYSKGIVDPFEYYSTFYKLLKIFKVADIEKGYKTTWINQNAVLFIFAFLASVQTFICTCHGIYTYDIMDITESGTYFIIMNYELLILSCTKLNIPQYHNLLKAMKDDFHFICTDGDRYRKRYFDIQLATWKICIFSCIFTSSIGVGMVVLATIYLLFYLATHKPGDGTSRPLLYPFWLPNVDFGKTPNYEMAFAFAAVCSVLYSYNYVFMLQTQIVWIRHVTSKVDIVVWSLQDLLEDIHPPNNHEETVLFNKLIISRMRKIIMHHQTMLSVMTDYALVYKKMLMYEQKLCGPVICLTAYCSTEKFEQGDFQSILPFLFFGTIVVHFIPCYFCTFLAVKVGSVRDACWDIPYWKAGPLAPTIRPYVILMMQRSLRPLPLQAPGFESISIETFSKKMTSAYSFYNMLRQTNI